MCAVRCARERSCRLRESGPPPLVKSSALSCSCRVSSCTVQHSRSSLFGTCVACRPSATLPLPGCRRDLGRRGLGGRAQEQPHL